MCFVISKFLCSVDHKKLSLTKLCVSGGDVDAASKTLLGVCKTNKGFYFLIAVSSV